MYFLLYKWNTQSLSYLLSSEPVMIPVKHELNEISISGYPQRSTKYLHPF